MCGIAGAIDGAWDRAAVRVGLLNEAQRHRGPDNSVVTRVGEFTLGNTRLAIQDPGPPGNQPFRSADGRYICVFNGEIYNHRRLAERFGLTVRTACDGEIIPELWSKLGVASLAELRGMFAIALVDSLEDRLYLARDPFGIKPLYWTAVPEGLLFASEVRPLAQVARRTGVDAEAVARYLHLGAVAPDRAPFLGINALAPNSVAVVDRNSRAKVVPIRAGGPLAVPDAPADLESALTDSIDLHLGADVPTALLLSAGVDSAVIAAVSRRLGRDLDCLTVAVGGADESGEAAQTARHYGHRFQRIPAALEEEDVARYFAAMQRPTIDGLNTYLVSRAVHDAGFKVALSGLGADEAVGGYRHFRLLRYLSALRVLDKMPRPAHHVAAKALAVLGAADETKLTRLLAPGGPRAALGLCLLHREVLPEPLVADLTGIRCWRPADISTLGAADEPDSFLAMTAAEVAVYLQAMLLPDADGFSMASSVELRVPFVDSMVFHAALRSTAGHGTRAGKETMAAALGDAFLRARAAGPKRGFSMPMRRWMTGPLAPVLRAVDEPDAPVWAVVDRAAARRAGLTALRSDERWSPTWALAALNAWLAAVGSDQASA